MAIKFECAHADTCLPDYWSGHHLPHVQIPVFPGMTMAQIKSAICSEIAQGAVMGSTDYARLLAADIVRPDEEKLADAVNRAAYAAINRMRPAIKGTRKFFNELDPVSDEDGADYVYAFFVFVECE